MSKLKNDFGVTALIAVIIIVGSFILLGIGVTSGSITISNLLPMIGSWVGSVVTAYFVVKGIKTGGGNGGSPTSRREQCLSRWQGSIPGYGTIQNFSLPVSGTVDPTPIS